jgi:hypothetical protein
LDLSLRSLLVEFGLGWQTVNPIADPMSKLREFDRLLLFGGGSMGAPYKPSRMIRNAAAASGVPCIVMPQSFMGPEPGPWETVYVRERESLRFCPNGILRPDLALGYDYPQPPPPDWTFGLFLRDEPHTMFPAAPKNDPAVYCYTPQEYIQHVQQFAHVCTDRLHVAIVALGLGRRVTLLPTHYHKNRSMYDTWLRDLGCEWSDSPLGLP